MPSPLPIDDVLPEITRSLVEAPSLVLKAPTGAGKTMRVAPALLPVLRAAGARDASVLLLEPRRVAARAAARRIAFEQGATLGNEIGYHVRFDRRTSDTTRIVAMTYGIFLRRLQDDPFLEGVGAVVLDEFHERSIDMDLAIAIARQTQREVRPDLRLVVMSATLDAGPIARFLGDAPVVESRGRSFPVEIRHRHVEDSRARQFAAARAAENAVVAAVRDVLGEVDGDVLVFLPGVGEIRRVHSALADVASSAGVDVADLYGDLPAEQQDAVLRRGQRRKIVLATNVAESSVTIENIAAVVDSGMARVLRLDARVGVDRLELGRISRASADQRAGRAGRTGPGLCIRLWSQHEDRALRPVEEPEIRRVDLSRALLELRAWGDPDPHVFEWFDAPEVSAIDGAEALLEGLGCLAAGALTPLGERLARLPLPPRVGRLLVEAERLGRPLDETSQRSLVARASIAAALLTERDPLRRTDDRSATVARHAAHESDVLERVLLLERFAVSQVASAGMDAGAAHSVLRVARDLERSARETAPSRTRGRIDSESQAPPSKAADAEERFLRALLAAYPDRVARRRAPGSDRAVMVGGRGVRLASESVVAASELFVCVAVDAGRRGERAESLVRQASAIDRAWLPAREVRSALEIGFDEAAGRVDGRIVTRYRDLVLEEKPADVPRDAAGEVLAPHAAADPERALELSAPDVRSWLERARCVAEWMPEIGLPAVDREFLAGVARDLAAGRRSFDEMRRLPVLDVLRATLGHEKLRQIDRHAPEHFEVPSGSRIRIDYAAGRAPVLAVRIQEIFGMAETPRIAAGRIAVVLHLLAPNHRPEQVTDDLASFWKTTYAEVRKQLRARYPKHAWPEDPLHAQAERRPQRRRG